MKDYWLPKLKKNIERDRIVTQRLQGEGWTVFRFWEHELNEIDTVTEKIQSIITQIDKGNLSK